MTTRMFSKFFSGREHIDPNLFSRLQLYTAAHPDVETSCVLSNLFRALYTNSELFFIESLQRLDAASQNVARELMHAKASNVFPKEAWENALELIAALPPERGGFGNDPSEFAAKSSVPFAFTEASANADPAIGSQAWFRAWALYFKWRLRRGASSAFAFAAQRGGFDSFKYLWGAPAAATVIAAFFGVALLDERLGLRSAIVSSLPVQWIAELIETEMQAEPVIEAQVENASIARLQPKAPPKPAEPKASRVNDAAISRQSEEPAQYIATENQSISEPASPIALDASEGVAGRIARAETASSQERPKIVVPREGNRPEQQTRPKPVAQLKRPAVIVPRNQVAPPPVSDLPLIAKVAETMQPVLHEVQSDLPKTPLLGELPPATNAAGPQGTKSGAAPIEIAVPELTPARSLDAGVGTEQAAAPAFIQRLQSGGRDERTGKGGTKQAIERRSERVEPVNRNRPSDFTEQLDRSGPSGRLERLDRSGPSDGLERVERVDRSGPGDRVERVDRSGPSDRVDRVERIDRSGPSDRVERIDRSGPNARLDRVERIDRSGPSNRVARAERIDRPGKRGRGD